MYAFIYLNVFKFVQRNKYNKLLNFSSILHQIAVIYSFGHKVAEYQHCQINPDNALLKTVPSALSDLFQLEWSNTH